MPTYTLVSKRKNTKWPNYSFCFTTNAFQTRHPRTTCVQLRCETNSIDRLGWQYTEKISKCRLFTVHRSLSNDNQQMSPCEMKLLFSNHEIIKVENTDKLQKYNNNFRFISWLVNKKKTKNNGFPCFKIS